MPPLAAVGDTDIYYETFGSTADPTVLLIMGLGRQMTGWDVAFCKQLASTGFHVVRFDNRDVGLSTRLPDSIRPDLSAAASGDALPYTLDDLALDAAGLLTAIGVDAAHVVGASMGGMIAQLLAIQHPERVKSLVSMMSTTGDPSVGQAHPDVVARLMQPLGADEDPISRRIELHRMIESPLYPLTERQLRAGYQIEHERSYSPATGIRQLCAIIAAPDRTESLSKLTIPVAVVQGEADAMVDVSGGRATAGAIRDAEYIEIQGMGHSLPHQLWPQVTDVIRRTAARA